MNSSTQIVVSLTTIPPRFSTVGNILNRLLSQSIRPHHVELYVPKTYRRFSGHAFCVPETPEGITVNMVENDFGPATKVLPCVERYRGTDTRVIYCDDDRLYPRNWLKLMLESTTERPKDCIVNVGADLEFFGRIPEGHRPLPRARKTRGVRNFSYWVKRTAFQARYRTTRLKENQRPLRRLFMSSGYVDIAEGFGGVSVSPDFFDDAAFEIPRVLWAVDDIWLSGHLARNGIGIWVNAKGAVVSPEYSFGTEPLYAAILDGKDRRSANLACIDYFRENYGVWT